MHCCDLSELGSGAVIDTDLVIIGAGPAGLTIAKQFFGTTTRVLVLESGIVGETSTHGSLNSVESVGDPHSKAQIARRNASHGANCPFWSQDIQPYGVRCRALGGSAVRWAGRVAEFEDADFAERAWVANSGWPFGLEELDPYIDRAAEDLNLGPRLQGDALWKRIGIDAPAPQPDRSRLVSFFWQYALSRMNKFDIMRFGDEFLTFHAENVRVLRNATATRICVDPYGTELRSIEISTIDGQRSTVTAKIAVVAAGGIENPRLLLNSRDVHANGLGNTHDTVGRFLMDHPSALIGSFSAEACPTIASHFGFFHLKQDSRSHVYAHGLVPARELVKKEQLLRCAAFMIEDRAPDDPFVALRRLLGYDQGRRFTDVLSIASNPALVAKAALRHVLDSQAVPPRAKQILINLVHGRHSGAIAHEVVSRGREHKLTGYSIHALCEQVPDPDSRLILSDKVDALGLPLPRVRWRIGDAERRTLLRIGQLIATELPRAGLPAPSMEKWIEANRADESVIVDMGHTCGTTRMANDAKRSVVDASCKVHGINGLYVAGASVFPTSGHANPTLMIAAMAIRLADHVKQVLHRQ